MKIQNHSRTCLMISAAIMVVALIMTLFGAGLNLGIDFAGGLSIRYDMKQTFEQEDIEAALQAQGVTDYNIARSGENGGVLQLRIARVSNEEEIQRLQSGLQEALRAKYPDLDAETATANYIGPIAGTVFVRNAIIGLLLAIVLAFIYTVIRFGINFGISLIVGLLHDVLITLSLMTVLRGLVQVNASFFVAMLVVAGCSVHSSIIIFDRVRENNRKPAFSKESRIDVVNVSIKESFRRTLNTALILLILFAALGILGAGSIRQFSVPVMMGILASVYSANFISSYVWAFLEDRRRGKKKSKLKAKKA